MSHQIQMKVFPRSETGKGPSRRLRAKGRFPAIIYGGKAEPQNVAINEHDFENELLHGLHANTLINVAVDGDSEPQLAILREAQRDPASHRMRHVDLYRISLDQIVEFEIPTHPTGDCPAMKQGGLVEHVLRAIHIRCKARNVPDAIEVPLEGLDFGHAIHVSDLELPGNVEVLNDSSSVVFSVVVPRAVVSAQAGEGAEGEEGEAEGEAPPAEGEEQTEPEVIGKGKKDEEEG